jgi:hypothetical protein
MKPQRTVFKGIAMAMVFAMFLGFVIVLPSVSAQEETPPTTTETPTEIAPEGTYFVSSQKFGGESLNPTSH